MEVYHHEDLHPRRLHVEQTEEEGLVLLPRETQEEEMEDVEGQAGETGTLGVMNASAGCQAICHHVLSLQGPYHRMGHVMKEVKSSPELLEHFCLIA